MDLSGAGTWPAFAPGWPRDRCCGKLAAVTPIRPPALLVALQLPGLHESDVRASLAELSRLVQTLGYEVVHSTFQKRSSDRTATVLGDGKLKEIARWTGGPGEIGKLFVRKKHKAALKFETADDDSDAEPEELASDDVDEEDDAETPAEVGRAEIVIFDCDLSPSQLRNLEKCFGVKVLDRTGVIIEIFSRHARTKAAKLQVEIARLTYVAPRLRETGGGEDRGGGGIGAKGAGETSVELDRRRIRDRIKELKDELAAIGSEQDHRRHRRAQEITVALVGYTNAGKSSLMRALTGSEVLVEDKLFATLDTTIRQMHPETVPRILISDTVGFIKKLPHDLVASFKSTLDEARHASLLLYVVDASDPSFRSQLEVTRRTLSEVGADNVDSWLVLNKSDRLTPAERESLAAEFPAAVFLSTRDPAAVAALRERLVGHFETGMGDHDLLIPYHVNAAVGEVRQVMRILSETHNERGFLFRVRVSAADLQRFKSKHGLQ